MKARTFLTALLILIVSTASAQKQGILKATYDTDFGTMSLTVNLDTRQVTGFYAGTGKILGIIGPNRTLTGAWVQKEQGMFEIKFSPDYTSFTGTYGIGTDAKGGTWKGTSLAVEKVTGTNVTLKRKPIERKGIYLAEYITDFGLMRLEINFKTKEINGTYGDGGLIKGKLDNRNRLTGTYERSDIGLIEFDFTPDFKNFTGKWGEDTVSLTDGVWMGESISVAPVEGSAKK